MVLIHIFYKIANNRFKYRNFILIYLDLNDSSYEIFKEFNSDDNIYYLYVTKLYKDKE